MPKMKQMIKRVDIEQAKRRRTCKFSGKPIEKDSLCLVLHEDSRDRYCYSKDIALKMIENAKNRLADLESILKG